MTVPATGNIGEVNVSGEDQPDPPRQNTKADQQPDAGPADTGKADSQDGGESPGGSGGDSLEDQLDAEKQKNLQLRRQLTAAENAKKKADLDKDVVKERDDYKARAESLEKLLSSKFLVWSIGTDKKYSWQNPEDVVKFIDTEEINIDLEKGKIEGLDLALKRIAKDKPYLLVQTTDDGAPPQRPPSGAHPIGSRSGATDNDKVRKLGEKYKIPGFGSQVTKYM